jgi:hypothetical protein
VLEVVMASHKPQRRLEDFKVTLTEDDEILVHLEREGRVVTKFGVQYRARIRGKWHAIVRFDTAHGHAHKDVSHPDGTQEMQELELDDYGVALTHALREVKARWMFYRERYERWHDES